MELDDESQPKILLADDSKMVGATVRKMLSDSFGAPGDRQEVGGASPLQ